MSNTSNTTGAGNTAAQMFREELCLANNDRGEPLAVWIIAGNSAINQFRWCILGEGATEAEAWLNSGRTKSRSRGRWAEHISWEHLNRIREASY